MRIDQVLPTYNKHDAIGHHVTNIQEILKKLGYSTTIYAENWEPAIKDHCQPVKRLFEAKKTRRVIIYHHSIGCSITPLLAKVSARIIVIYHNITPPQYFSPNSLSQWRCSEGIHQLHLLRLLNAATWTVSKYNATELVKFGFPQPDIFPIIRNYEKLLLQPPEASLFSHLSDGRPNIIFIGRMAPNKAIHDHLVLFATLRDQFHFVIKPRLIIAGKKDSAYFANLTKLAKQLGLTVSTNPRYHLANDICFLHHITESQLAAVYRSAKAFLCLSDHEGFCVPLVESMFFGIPTLAHQSSAGLQGRLA